MDEARALERKAVRAVLERAQVVCVTLRQPAAPACSPDESFDMALIDEATQATEPLTLLGFLRAPKVVLAGDPKQLPPTVLSQEAAKAGLAMSLFERLLQDHGEGVKRMLREQYRMNTRIMAFPSREMYGGELRAHAVRRGPHPGGRATPGAEVDAPPVLFLDTAGKGFDEQVEESTHSLFNPGEAELVVARVKALLAAGLAPRELAVITPYSAQAFHLRERVEALLAGRGGGHRGRLPGPGEGRHPRSPSPAATPRASWASSRTCAGMNVALTRARRHLFVVGDSATLSAATPSTRASSRAPRPSAGYRSAWEWPEP